MRIYQFKWYGKSVHYVLITLNNEIFFMVQFGINDDNFLFIQVLGYYNDVNPTLF
jgi:hypothetical protein